jgi:hypothetical protein
VFAKTSIKQGSADPALQLSVAPVARPQRFARKDDEAENIPAFHLGNNLKNCSDC